jgi:hypothetical protein
MYARVTVARALELARDGLSPSDISRTLSVDRSTIRAWLAGSTPRTFRRPTCELCNGDEHDFASLPPAYVYLLGLYLGDGCISVHPRGVYKLRLVLDVKYPEIIAEASEAMRAVGAKSVRICAKPQRCVEVFSYARAWPCLFPQHGPGKKHHRSVALVPWQQMLVDRWPAPLVRGLIESDGCRFQNTGRNWSCPRYSFYNKSNDIHSIFCDACDRLGVRWTSSGDFTLYVSRKADVEFLDGFIGPKR